MMKWNVFFIKSYIAILAAGVLCASLSMVGCFAQSQEQPAVNASVTDESLKKFLQSYTKIPGLPEDKTTRYFDSLVDLNGDGKEVIVYLTGPQWCGSGGCTALILAPEGSSYRVVTKVTVAQRPIRVLSTTSNGWHSLGVWVHGGGVQGGHEAILIFNGKTYPSNPTVPPAQRSTGKAEGKTVIPEELKDLKAIYP
jgi:hypothetical protein